MVEVSQEVIEILMVKHPVAVELIVSLLLQKFLLRLLLLRVLILAVREDLIILME